MLLLAKGANPRFHYSYSLGESGIKVPAHYSCIDGMLWPAALKGIGTSDRPI